MTTTEQLAEINAAISAILGGAQEYRTLHKSVRRADLGALFAERKNLEAKLAAESGYQIGVAVFDGR